MDTNLSTADASFLGEDISDRSGFSVASAGDVNNDGYNDFLIGAITNDDGGIDAGETYLILGKATGWAIDTHLSSADASFWGESAGDWSGYCVAPAGDVNNDGYDDFLIGARYNDDGGTDSGQSYLILGYGVTIAPVDIKPTSCPNPLNAKNKGILPVAILGTDSFDATLIDPSTITLQGVPPIRWAIEDVAAPYEPYMGKEVCADCTTAGPDGYSDLTLQFDTQAIMHALGEVQDGDCVKLTVTGWLSEEFDRIMIIGEDLVWILRKGGGR
jgi:hypothetical protein